MDRIQIPLSHVLYINEDILTRLVISSANASANSDKNKKRKKKADEEASQQKVELFNRSLELDVLLPIADKLKNALPLNESSDGSPQLVQSVLLTADETGTDPTMFNVCMKSDVVEKLSSSGLKRKRTSSKKSTAQKHILFTLQVIDEFQALNRELTFLVKSFPKNYKVYIDGPKLELNVTFSDHQQLHLSGCIKYTFAVHDTIDSIGTYAMQSQTLQSLISTLVNDETFELPTASLTPKLSYEGFYGVISKNKTRPIKTPLSISIPGFKTDLFKFQRETLHWCLRRENKDLDKDGTDVIDLDPDVRICMVAPPQCWRRILVQENSIMVNPYTGVICSQEEFNRAAYEDAPAVMPVSGGLLAEGTGLGKTVEIIALIILNKRPQEDVGVSIFDNFASRTVTKCKTTLIIAPESSISQWVKEIGIHAPMLKVYYYPGVEKLKGSVKARDLSEYDVVVTTYSVISYEDQFAQFNPEARSTRRGNKIHPNLEAKKSPLMELEFWRVILDEPQMAASGISGAAKVTEMFPRVHSWAVTGTPVQRQLDELQGLMVLFRLSPFSVSSRAWAQLLATNDFELLFANLSFRHTAFTVGHDLSLPPQSRVTVHLSFNPIEEANYRQLYSEFLDDIGLKLKPNRHTGRIYVNPEGGQMVAGSSGYGLAEEQNEVGLATSLVDGKLTSWYGKLRQACSLPRILHNGKSYGIKGAASAMDDLLAGMLEQAESQLSNYQKKYYSSIIERGQLREAQRCPKDALDLWLYASAGVEKIVETLRAKVAKAEEEQLKRKTMEGKEATQRVNVDRIEKNDKTVQGDNEYNKGDQDDDNDENDDDDDDDDVKEIKARLRSWIKILHKCYFLVSTANYQLAAKLIEDSRAKSTNVHGAPGVTIKTEELSEEDPVVKSFRDNESKYYELAEMLRRELLRCPILKVNKAMGKLNDPESGKPKPLVEIPKVAIPESSVPQLVQESYNFKVFNQISKALDRQASVIADLREQLWKLSLEKLVDQNADPNGEEYGESLDAQEMAFCYLEALRGFLCDRTETIGYSSSPVVDIPVKLQRHYKKTDNTSLKNYIKEESLLTEANRQSEIRDLELVLKRLRAEYNPRVKQYPIQTPFRHLQRIKWLQEEIEDFPRKLQAEQIVAELPRIQKSFDDLQKSLKALQRELAGFRKVYNARVEYYMQLQELSVESLELPKTDLGFGEQFETNHREEEEELLTLTQLLESHIIYLRSLKKMSEVEEVCGICQGPIVVAGSLTMCGHRFCRSCLQKSLDLREECPICKTALNIWQIYNYRVNKCTVTKLDIADGADPSYEDTTLEDSNMGHYLARTNPIYRDVDGDTLNTVLSDTSLGDTGSYGTKVDVIIKHLHWLRSKEPDAQVVIFSQSADMLELLSDILTRRGVLYATVESNMKEFRRDKRYTCLLLHAKHEYVGLTLLNATHVYLCEPFLNAALEVQAISRIYGIGQTKPTTVWLFVISVTVEESVLRLGATKRLHFLKASLPVIVDGQEGDSSMIDTNNEESKQSTNDETNSHGLAETTRELVHRTRSDHGEVVDIDDLYKVLISYHYQRVD